MALLRIVNAFYAALFVVMALVSLAFLSGSLSDRLRVPENVWVSVGWAALFLVYSGLAFANMRRCRAEGPKDRLIALNAAAAVPMLAGMFGGEATARFLCGAAALPFVLTALALVRRRRSEAA